MIELLNGLYEEDSSGGGGDSQTQTKTVTNTTGSAITRGDKVWVDGDYVKSFIDTTY